MDDLIKLLVDTVLSFIVCLDLSNTPIARRWSPQTSKSCGTWLTASSTAATFIIWQRRNWGVCSGRLFHDLLSFVQK